jgi:dsRNA-specific ribonuclease
MANVPTPGFQKLWSNETEALRLEYGDTTQQHPDAGAVVERVCEVLAAIARLAGGTPATRRNLHQLLKRKQLHSARYGAHTEVLHNLTAILKESAVERETAKITSTEPPSNEEFRERRRRELKPSNDADKRAKKLATSTAGVNDSHLRSKEEVPIRKFFAHLP